jgi:hypothetical protein
MAEPGDGHAPVTERPSRSERAALITFLVAGAVALPLLLYWGRRTWFVIDDWDFLATRAGGSPHDLFRAHAGHWTTLPVIAYRLLWRIVGIRSYGAYMSVLIVVHLLTALLLRAVMRRGDVAPWLATAFAVVFVYLGSGAANIVIAFQITFAGSLCFGLAQLLLAVHDGPVDRRDYLGLLCGLAALMCSGVGVAMVVAVGVATLLRRGYRVALVHTVPLATVYLVWFAAIGRDDTPRAGRLTVSGFFHEVVQGVEAAFSGIGRLNALGLVYFLMLLVGAALISRRRDTPLSDGVASALGLLAAALFFVGSTALTRSAPFAGATNALGPHNPRAGRYVYVIAALVLPALALAAQAIIRAWRPAVAFIGAMLLVSFVGNVHTFSQVAGDASVAYGIRRHVLTVPRLPQVDELPGSLIVVPRFVPVTIRWLTDAARAGKLASPGRLSESQIAASTLSLMIRPSPRSRNCRPLTASVQLRLRANEGLRVGRGAVTVEYRPRRGSVSPPAILIRGGSVYNVFRDPVRLFIARIPRFGPASLCVATRPVRESASRP